MKRWFATFVFRCWSPRRIGMTPPLAMLAAVNIVSLVHTPAIAQNREPLSSSAPRSAATVAALQVVPGEVDLSLSAPVEVRHEYLRGHGHKADRCYIDLSPATFVSQA